MRKLLESMIQTLYFTGALAMVLLWHSELSMLPNAEEDFLYLAGIVEDVTRGRETQTEQVKALTRWLAEHVIKSTAYPGWERADYPPWFDWHSVASVIRGGIGNCGYQARNVLALARYLGVYHRWRWSVGPKSGASYEHSFAELIVDGRSAVFDPNLLIFQEDENGRPLSLTEMIREPSRVENDLFRRIVAEIKDRPEILERTEADSPPEPLGVASYDFYRTFGARLTRMYLHLKSDPLRIVIQTWVVFLALWLTRLGLGALGERRRRQAVETDTAERAVSPP